MTLIEAMKATGVATRADTRRIRRKVLVVAFATRPGVVLVTNGSSLRPLSDEDRGLTDWRPFPERSFEDARYAFQ